MNLLPFHPGASIEADLINHLLHDQEYNKFARPVEDPSKTIEVMVELEIKEFRGLVFKYSLSVIENAYAIS
jgi:hypothetical protein